MLREALDRIFEKHGVKIAYLFGSQQEAGLSFLQGKSIDIEKGSDLDVGVVFERLPQKAFDVYGDLFADLSLELDPFAVDLVFLQETNSLFQYEAICGKRVYCKDEFFCDDYEELVMKKASDLAFKRKEFERDFLEAIRDGYFEITRS
jgi:predicted nucleotidyltransferase